MNVAVTLSAALIVTTQLPVPVQAPLHPPNVLPLPAVPVSVTVLPSLKFALHVLGQLIPLGLLTTLPVPVPASVTLNANALAVNVAVTASFPLIAIEHVAPLQSSFPLHPVNVLPLPAVAVNVTTVPAAKLATHVELVEFVQLIPVGLLTTLPVPVPAKLTVSV